MEPKIRGIINIIGALVVGYLAYTETYMKWAVILLAVLFLLAGYHHVSRK